MAIGFAFGLGFSGAEIRVGTIGGVVAVEGVVSAIDRADFALVGGADRFDAAG